MAESVRIIGLMSGTSADGIDAVLAEIVEPATPLSGEPPAGFLAANGLFVRVAAHVHEPYAEPLRRRLFTLFDVKTARIDELTRLDRQLGRAFGRAAVRVCQAAGIPLPSVAAIASHGQTVHHLPPGEGEPGGTLQIGRSAEIAAVTGCRVIDDFRAADIAAGGQGAPLAPFADWRLFGGSGRPRLILNLGGIANVTYLPAGGDLAAVRAFDTGPANMVIDGLVQRLSGGLQRFDAGGQRAARGRADAALVAEWLCDPYFALPPPKSTGRERFGRAFIERAQAQARARGLTPDDLIASATAFADQSVAQQIRRWLPDTQGAELIAGGGGTRNAALLRMLGEALPDCGLSTHAAHGIDDQAKEALAFALLGYETLCGRPANIPGATGATRPVVLGSLTSAPAPPGEITRD